MLGFQPGGPIPESIVCAIGDPKEEAYNWPERKENQALFQKIGKDFLEEMAFHSDFENVKLLAS